MSSLRNLSASDSGHRGRAGGKDAQGRGGGGMMQAVHIERLRALYAMIAGIPEERIDIGWSHEKAITIPVMPGVPLRSRE